MSLTSLLLVSFTACQMREIAPIDDQAHISIDVDWSNMNQLPTGMTVYFYPENGRPPYKYYTNDINHIERSLPEMNYEILLFNQTIEEFSSFSFRGMDNINTAEIYSVEEDDKYSLIDKLYHEDGSRAFSKSQQIQPQCIAAGRGSASKPTRGYTDKSVIKPVIKVGQLTATIHVKGLSNVKKTNGALSGLASGALLALDGLSSPSLIQEMNDWAISESDNIGTVSTVIGTYGLSPSLDHTTETKSRTVNGGRFIEPTSEDESRNILYLNFLLKDNTYVAYRFDVTNYIKNFTTEAEVELVLDLGTNVEQYITIPETGIPYNNVPISVQPWGQEEVDHNITL